MLLTVSLQFIVITHGPSETLLKIQTKDSSERSNPRIAAFRSYSAGYDVTNEATVNARRPFKLRTTSSIIQQSV